MNARCLICYEGLEEGLSAYHNACLKKKLGISWVPRIELLQKDFPLLAQKMAGQMSISGAQPKITVQLNKEKKAFEMMPSGGAFILKPQTQNYARLPENEDLCMHLAELYQIQTPSHLLVKTAEGELAYLIQRFDISPDGSRLPVEDFGQILAVASERKYSGSYEKIAQGILQYCSNKYLELTRFFERLLFCFAIGNGDMHLKNFSLVTRPDELVALSPAYDLLSSKLVIPGEEDLPLSLLGKRNEIKGGDFLSFGKGLDLDPKAMRKSMDRLLELEADFHAWVHKSFLPMETQERFDDIITTRMARLRQ